MQVSLIRSDSEGDENVTNDEDTIERDFGALQISNASSKTRGERHNGSSAKAAQQGHNSDSDSTAEVDDLLDD